jgi:TP901 family phage tail tape measure protein
MAAKFLEVAVILTAMDKMSGVVNAALGKTTAGFEQLASAKERAGKYRSDTFALGAGAAAAIGILGKASNAYGDLQAAELDMRNSIMRPGGVVNEADYQKSIGLAEKLRALYRATPQAYIEMISELRRNKLTTADIVGGVGNATALLADVTEVDPTTTALTMARLKNDYHTKASEAYGQADLINRFRNTGMGTTGDEVMHNMTELSGQLGVSASLLGLHGLKAMQDVTTLGAMWMSKGMSGGTVATNMRKIFDSVRSPDKVAKMNVELAKLGKHLTFFDDKGNFKGVDNMNAQFGLLKDLTPSQMEVAFKPFGARNGMAGDMAQYISKYANELEDYKALVADHGTLQQNEYEKRKGQNYQWDKLTSSFTNMIASIGELNSPGVVGGMKSVTAMFDSIAKYTKTNPGTSQFIIDLADIGAGILTAATVVSASKWAFTSLWPSTVISWVGGTTAWTTAATFASDAVWGLIASFTALGAGVVAVGAGIAAMAAGPVAFALWEANYGSASKMLKGAQTEEKNYVPMSKKFIDDWNKSPTVHLPVAKRFPGLDSAMNIHVHNHINIRGDVQKTHVDTLLKEIPKHVKKGIDSYFRNGGRAEYK